MSEANGRLLAFIDDGQTEAAYIAGQERLYPELRFEYRPALPSELSAYYRLMNATKDADADSVAATWAAARMVSWSVADRSGNPVTANAASMLRLRPGLFFRLLRIIRGDEAGDIDPSLATAQQEQEKKDREAATAAGKTLDQYRRERDEKNLLSA